MSTAERASPLLFGRDLEIEMLRVLLDRIRDGGAAVLVRGEAGIGKSALLTATSAVAHARQVRLLTTTGVGSETRLPFAGLHELLRPILKRAEDLPRPQRRALGTAFGTVDAPAPDLFLIGLAALNLLADASVEAPVLLVVDDAHWLDGASVDVLTFIARRLESEPIVLIAAIRDGFHSPLEAAGLPELALDALDDDTAAALLDARAPALEPALRARVLDEAAGNPLALVELPIAAERLADRTAPLSTPLPLTARLERAFAARVPDLPHATRIALLVGAVNDSDSLSEAISAASIVRGEPLVVHDLTPAIAARLVDADTERLRFRHPLVRSAIQQSSSVADRQSAHAALAQLLPSNSDRRAWHRAESASGPDESVALELENAAQTARSRGAIVAAVGAFERSATLSEDPSRQAERLLRAAEMAVELGQHEAVFRLTSTAAELELSAQQRAHLVWIRGSFDDGIRDDASAASSVAQLAEEMAASGDIDLSLRLLWYVALRLFWNNARREAREGVIAAAERLQVAEDDPRFLAILAFAAPIERGAVVIERARAAATHARGDSARLLGNALLLVGAFDTAVRLSAVSLADLRAQGRLGLLARALVVQAYCSAQLVDLSVTIPAAEEGGRLADETSQPVIRATARATEAIVAALRGDQDRTEALATEAERGSMPVGARPVLAAVQQARGLAALAEGRPAHAYAHLRRTQDPTDPAYHFALRCYVLQDLADAAVQSGEPEAIRPIIEEMETLARATPSPALHTGLRHARALLANDDDAEPLFEAALGADLGTWPFARARTQLAYGAWLRRRRRVADSRVPLRSAREAFDALGAAPWSERARQELRASGETSRRRIPATRDQLTPQELQIAQMAAEGLSNREIGLQLFISHRTVGAHLHRIFPKLGVTSRGQLRSALEATVVPSAP